MSNSWSGLRKELEQDFLCEALRGRVQYFCTHYHGAPDNYGRICVRVDGTEHIMGNPYNYCIKGYYDMEAQIKRENNIPMRQWTGKDTLFEEENQQVEDVIHTLSICNGDFEIYDITDSIYEYKHLPIEQSLNSNNPLVRMLAIMDRRVGKRTLKKLVLQINQQPEWLQFFYRLRLEAEEI